MDFELSEEQRMFRAMVKAFREKELDPIAKELDRVNHLPDGLIKKYADMGLYGMSLPPEYGGTGADYLAHILALEELAYSGTPACWPVALNNSIPQLIYQYGTPEQRDRFLKGALDGSKLFSIQFTEADTGSDPDALTTTAKRDGDYYVINGMKRFSTFGAREGTAVCFAKDDQGDCTAFLVEKNAPGYSAPKVWELMGGGGVEAADVYYDNYRVPKENILGAQGKGFDILLSFVGGEKIDGCIVAVAFGQAALDEAIQYADNRMVRGRPMSAMQGIRWELADMHARIQACRWFTYRTALLYAKGDPTAHREAAALKIFVQPTVNEVITTAFRLHGGYGYTKEFKVERLYRAQPGNMVIAVSLEINKSIVGGSLVR